MSDTLPDRVISELQGFDGLRFHPVKLLKVVNHLITQGASQSWNVLQNYARESQRNVALRPENALVVARVLFVATGPEQPWPRLELGTPDIREPGDPRRFPSWPLHIESGLPLMLVGGYTFGGQATPVEVQLAAYRAQLTIRTTKLVPDGCPFDLVERFVASDDWKQLGPRPDHDDMLRLQAWWAIENLVPLTPNDERVALTTGLGRHRWSEIERLAKTKRPTWDPQANEYRSEA